MLCSVCLSPLPDRALSVLGLRLCPACREKLCRQRADRREYDWYVGFVRRALMGEGGGAALVRGLPVPAFAEASAGTDAPAPRPVGCLSVGTVLNLGARRRKRWTDM